MRLRFIAPLAAAAAIAVPVGTATAHHGGQERGGDRHGNVRQEDGPGRWHRWHRHDNGFHRGFQKVCGLDAQYLMTAIEGDRFEIAGGTLALTKTSNPQVRTLAQTLISDHSQSLQEAIALAQKLGVDVPSDPSPTQQWALDTVSGLSGAAFDRSWSSLEVADHEQDIDETSFEARYGCNREVRQDAAQEIPVLQHHLQLAQTALASVS
jgi:putative membrane protein